MASLRASSFKKRERSLLRDLGHHGNGYTRHNQMSAPTRSTRIADRNVKDRAHDSGLRSVLLGACGCPNAVRDKVMISAISNPVAANCRALFGWASRRSSAHSWPREDFGKTCSARCYERNVLRRLSSSCRSFSAFGCHCGHAVGTNAGKMRGAKRKHSLIGLFGVVMICFGMLPVALAQQKAGLYTKNGYDNENGSEPICWVAPAHMPREGVRRLSGYSREAYGERNVNPSNQRRRRRQTSVLKNWLFEEGVANDNLGDVVAPGSHFDQHEQDYGLLWPSALNPNFLAGPTQTLESCPKGTLLQFNGPREKEGVVGMGTLRTGQPHRFHVVAHIPLESWRKSLHLARDAFFHEANSAVAIRILFCPVQGQFCTPFLFDHPKIVHDLSEDMEEHDNEVLSNVAVLRVDDRNTTVQVDVSMSVTVGFSGPYIPLASLQFFLTNGTGNAESESHRGTNAVYKLDVANTLSQESSPERIIFFRNPDVDLVGKGVKHFSYALIVLAVSFQLVLVLLTIRHMSNPVIRLSQGGFLVFYLVDGTVAAASCFLFLPKNDLYCQLYGPCVMIPLQLMLAIVIGRLKRIFVIMSPLASLGADESLGSKRQQKQTIVGLALPDWMTREASASETSGPEDGLDKALTRANSFLGKVMRRFSPRQRRLRTRFTSRQLIILISLLVTPQVIVQILGLWLFPQKITERFSGEMSSFRYVCASDNSVFFGYFQFAILGMTVFLLLFHSQRSRHLPSLFNEGHSLSNSIFTTIFVTMFGAAVISVADSADATYFIMVSVTLCLTVNLSWRLVVPKLRLIWSGEKIAVGQLLAERSPKESAVGGVKTALQKSRRRLSAIVRLSGSSATEAASSSSGLPKRTWDQAAAVVAAEVDNDDDERPSPQSPHRKDAASPTAFSEKVEVESTDHSVADEEEPKDKAQTALLSENEHDDSLDDDRLFKSKDTASSGDMKPAARSKNPRTVSFHTLVLAAKAANSIGLGRTGDTTNSASGEGSPSGKTAAVRRWKQTAALVVQELRTPPQKVTMNLIQHHKLVSRINRRIFSGLQVPREEWEELVSSLKTMEELFADVEFDWLDQIGASDDEYKDEDV